MNNNNNDDKAVWLHANPSVIQHNILKDMEETLAGGKTITSPNSVASFMIESFSNMSANIMLDTLDELGTMFPYRITFSDDLHKHMSDYDYVDMFSTPSVTNLEMLIELDTINEKAIWNAGNTIGVLKIPYGTRFMIGRYTYSIHHPIDIRVNSGTNTVTVVYDGVRPNPLNHITNNVVESRVFNDSGVDIVAIKIPVYQFARVIETEDVFTNTPFSRKYQFTSKFYAVRIYTNYTGTEINGDNFHVDHTGTKWWELDQSFNEEVYDPDSNDPPTALIDVDTEASILNVTIPFIYISRQRLGSQLRIEILTTEGSVDIDAEKLIGAALPTMFPLTGDIESDKYTIPLTVANKVFVGVLNTRIAGGSNSMAFAELRRRVINSSYGEGILIVPGDVEAFLSDIGFRVSKFKDGITSRIFLCHKELTDKAGGIVASGVLSTKIDTSSIADNDNVSAIKYFPEDGSYTILPTAIYKYDEDEDVAIALTDNEIVTLDALPNGEKVGILNSNTYTHSPFYTKIDINNGVPVAYTYDLEDPSIESVTFKAEAGGVQLSIYAAVIKFNPREDVYNLTIDVICSDTDLRGLVVVDPVDPNPVRVVVSTHDNINKVQYTDGLYIGDGAAGSMRFTFDIATTYKITNNNELSLLFDNSVSPALLDFNFSLDVVGYVSSDALGIPEVTGLSVDTSNVHQDLYAASHSVIEIKLGDQVEEVFNAIDIAYESTKPEVYDVDTYAKHETVVYSRDQDGNIIYQVVNSRVILAYAFEIGDYILVTNSERTVAVSNDIFDEDHISKYYGNVVLDTSGNSSNNVIITADNGTSIVDNAVDGKIDIATPVLIGKAGTPKLDTLGDINVQSREVHYRVSMIHINRKLLYTSDISKYANYKDVTEYTTSLRKLILSHCADVAASKDRLIPNTEIYYRPSRSIGKARFKVSSSDVSLHTLEIGVDLKLHVLRHVMNNEVLQSKIRDNVINIIDSHTTRLVFSLTDIANEIVKAMPQDVSSVDVIGIDGKHNDQTLVHVDDGAILNLKHYLNLERDGSISISRAIDIGFIASELEDVVER